MLHLEKDRENPMPTKVKLLPLLLKTMQQLPSHCKKKLEEIQIFEVPFRGKWIQYIHMRHLVLSSNVF